MERGQPPGGGGSGGDRGSVRAARRGWRRAKVSVLAARGLLAAERGCGRVVPGAAGSSLCVACDPLPAAWVLLAWGVPCRFGGSEEGFSSRFPSWWPRALPGWGEPAALGPVRCPPGERPAVRRILGPARSPLRSPGRGGGGASRASASS